MNEAFLIGFNGTLGILAALGIVVGVLGMGGILLAFIRATYTVIMERRKK